MSEQKWEVGPVKLVNGHDATIYRYCKKRWRYIGEWNAPSGAIYAAEWTASGRHSTTGVGDPALDLASPKKTMRVGFVVNIYQDGSRAVHKTLKSAKHAESSAIFARIVIDREVTEGEGLSETPN